MTIRILGAILILLGCGGAGFLLAAACKQETTSLKNFIQSMNIMESELRYRKTPLPFLCHYIAATQSGVLRTYFFQLENELQQQIQPDASACAVLALNKTPHVPKTLNEIIIQFARSLGEFDLEGQLLGIQAVRNEAIMRFKLMSKDQEQRIKNYRTFGVCAGAAIIILFI